MMTLFLRTALLLGYIHFSSSCLFAEDPAIEVAKESVRKLEALDAPSLKRITAADAKNIEAVFTDAVTAFRGLADLARTDTATAREEELAEALVGSLGDAMKRLNEPYEQSVSLFDTDSWRASAENGGMRAKIAATFMIGISDLFGWATHDVQRSLGVHQGRRGMEFGRPSTIPLPLIDGVDDTRSKLLVRIAKNFSKEFEKDVAKGGEQGNLAQDPGFKAFKAVLGKWGQAEAVATGPSNRAMLWAWYISVPFVFYMGPDLFINRTHYSTFVSCSMLSILPIYLSVVRDRGSGNKFYRMWNRLMRRVTGIEMGHTPVISYFSLDFWYRGCGAASVVDGLRDAWNLAWNSFGRKGG